IVVLEAVRRLLRRGTRRRRRTAAARRTATAAALAAIAAVTAGDTALTASAARTAEHLHLVRDDVGRVALDAVLVGVLVRAQRAFDVHLPALLEIFAGDLAELAEQHDAVPLGALLVLAGLLVLPALRRRETDVR